MFDNFLDKKIKKMADVINFLTALLTFRIFVTLRDYSMITNVHIMKQIGRYIYYPDDIVTRFCVQF
jgi:hypothetical protein